MQDIAERFSDPRPIILDGATSTELQRLGVPMSADTGAVSPPSPTPMSCASCTSSTCRPGPR